MSEGHEPRRPGPGDPEVWRGPGEEPRAPGTHLAAVAGALVLIGLVAYGIYRRGHPPVAPAAPPAASQAAPAVGTPIAAVVPVKLSPEASIIAERYRCVCGCKDLLNVCTCNKTPGSNDMKKALQALVDQRKGPQEIDAAMIARYGSAVLLSNPAR